MKHALVLRRFVYGPGAVAANHSFVKVVITCSAHECCSSKSSAVAKVSIVTSSSFRQQALMI